MKLSTKGIHRAAHAKQQGGYCFHRVLECPIQPFDRRDRSPACKVLY